MPTDDEPKASETRQTVGPGRRPAIRSPRSDRVTGLRYPAGMSPLIDVSRDHSWRPLCQRIRFLLNPMWTS
jgi:hypothetical protein